MLEGLATSVSSLGVNVNQMADEVFGRIGDVIPIG